VSRKERVEFWHLTFQEHLAARTIAGFPDSKQHELILPHLYKSEWRETILLYVGLLGAKQGLEKVDAVLGAMLDKGGSSLLDRAKCVGLLGSILVDLKPLGYELRDRRFGVILGRVMEIFDSRSHHTIPLRVRLAAAIALGQTGDPRLADGNWVTIPAGRFSMGEEEYSHEVELDSYQIGKYPVTVLEFGRFVASGTVPPEKWDQQLQYPNRPVVNVAWEEAAAYCSWAKCRLPTEAEWERAARGVEGRPFPWGTARPNANRANFDETGIGSPTPVGLFPLGSTPEGVEDLAGNVWEWVSDWYAEDPPKIVRNPLGPPCGDARVLRGGSWNYVSGYLSAANLIWMAPTERRDFIGFRCARTV
jgi:formylglycine-generating enzyme required for sulfatase activity